MRIAFRVDASLHMATGHVMRCRTLASALVARGAQVLFICRKQPGHLIDLLQAGDFEVSVLPPVQPGEVKSSPWLQVSPEVDAAQSIDALQGWGADWLIVDQYGLDQVWEALVRPYVGSILVIDDQANRDHLADILLDQNYFLQPADRYSGRVPEKCRLLLGPRYALLRSDYGLHPQRHRPRDGQVKRILLFVGGADTGDVTGRLLRILSVPPFHALELDVVVGASYKHRASLLEAIGQRGGANLHERLPHLADVMARADLAIGAGGTTLWERLCMGLPAVVISLAPNQEPVCEALEQAEAIHYLGPSEVLSDTEIAAGIGSALEAPETLARQSLIGQCLVDGLGALRVAEAILPSAASSLLVRQARPEDALTYFDWANDPGVRKSAINSQPIPLATHRTWFANRLASGQSDLLVLEAAGLPVGQVRFDYHDNGAWIDYSLDPIARGRGWAPRLLSLGIRAAARSHSGYFMAEVKPDNSASIAVFKRIGFEELPTNGGLRRFRLARGNARKRA